MAKNAQVCFVGLPRGQCAWRIQRLNAAKSRAAAIPVDEVTAADILGMIAAGRKPKRAG